MKNRSQYNLIKKLGSFTYKMINVTSLEALAEVVESALEEFTPVEYTGLYLFHPYEKKLKLLFAKGFTAEEKRLAEETAMDRHPGIVFREKREIHIPDVDSDKQKLSSDSPRSFKVMSRLYLPVLNNDECVGTFGITSSKKNRFSLEDREMLRFICQFAGMVYAKLLHEEERKAIISDLELKERAIKSSQNGIIITDSTQPDNPTIYCNPAFLKMTGYEEKEVIGRNCRFLQRKDTDQEGLTSLRKNIKNGKACTVKVRNYKKDGSLFWNELTISPILDENKKIRFFIGILSDITHQVMIERGLTESKTRLSELIQSAASGILVEDEHRRIVIANNEFCNLFGIPTDPEHHIGLNCADAALHSMHLFKNPDIFVSRIEKILTDRLTVKNEEIEFNDGRVFERDYVPIFISTEYKGHLWNYRDITKRKLAEKRLQESKDYAQSIIDSLPDLLFVINNKEEFIDYKADPADLIIKPEQFLNQHYKKVLPLNLSTIIESAISEIKKKNEPIEINYTISVDKEKNHYSGKGIPFGNDSIIFIVRNITSLKSTEYQLQKQNDLQSILMQISSKYINIPLTEVDRAINESLQIICRFVGADRSYIFSYNFNDNTSSNTYEWCEEGITPQIEELQNIPNDFIPDWVQSHKNGNPLIIPNVSALPKDSNLREILEPQEIKTLVTLPMIVENQCIGFVGFDWVKDLHIITEIEKKLLGVFAQLVVNINIRKEAETQIKIEKQNVELSNKTLSDFAYIASHDLREPLRKISAFGSLLMKSLSQKLDEDDKENLDFMIDGANRMQQMIDDLLYYSRVTTKAKKYNLINLDDLVNEIIRFDLAQIIEDNYARIRIENELGNFRGEKTQLKQLFQNLIGNGIKYRKKSIDPIIKISSKTSSAELIIEIEDNGIGIDEKYKDQIFEMFKRLHSKREYEGSGIGLAICKKIVNLYKGDIELNSKLGLGSKFIIKLPVTE